MSTDKKDVKYDRCEICGLKDICVYDKEKLEMIQTSSNERKINVFFFLFLNCGKIHTS